MVLDIEYKNSSKLVKAINNYGNGTYVSSSIDTINKAIVCFKKAQIDLLGLGSTHDENINKISDIIQELENYKTKLEEYKTNTFMQHLNDIVAKEIEICSKM